MKVMTKLGPKADDREFDIDPSTLTVLDFKNTIYAEYGGKLYSGPSDFELS